MKELIQLYNQFLKNFYSLLSNQNPQRASEEKKNEEIGYINEKEVGKFIVNFGVHKYENPTAEELQQFITKHKLKIPNDIQLFLLTFPGELSADVRWKDNEEHTSYLGFDFYNLKYLERDMQDFKELAELNIVDREKFQPEYDIHAAGIPISYSEPQLVYSPTDGRIYFMIYDGGMPEFPIADSFEEFFRHYLASGCFRSHYFKPHWELVKDIVPIKIPISDNKWLQFYKQVYQNFTDIE